MKETFEKIRMITTQHDRLLHYGIISIEGDDAYVSDKPLNIPSKSFRSPVTVERLENLRADTVTAWARVVSYNMVRIASSAPGDDAWHERAKKPWKFKVAHAAKRQT